MQDGMDIQGRETGNTHLYEAGVHPAAQWAGDQVFTTVEIDCTITVVLKILDGKCRMLPGEKAAVMKIYDVVNKDSAGFFNSNALAIIERARAFEEEAMSRDVARRIHELRVIAESVIARPVMKRYKARLRDGLFG